VHTLRGWICPVLHHLTHPRINCSLTQNFTTNLLFLYIVATRNIFYECACRLNWRWLHYWLLILHTLVLVLLLFLIYLHNIDTFLHLNFQRRWVWLLLTDWCRALRRLRIAILMSNLPLQTQHAIHCTYFLPSYTFAWCTIDFGELVPWR
jgi:hypothetical protein